MGGVFCVEGTWKDGGTVRPLLELLYQGEGVPFRHHQVGTVKEFERRVRAWKRSKRYPTLYIAAHGNAGGRLYVTQRERNERGLITLGHLARMIGEDCGERHVHIGCCSTLWPERYARWFLDKTKVGSVSGYTTSVDWIESAAFELLLLRSLTRPARKYLRGVTERRTALRNLPHSMWQDLGFTFLWQ